MRQLFEDLDKKLAILGVMFSIILAIYLAMSVECIIYVLTAVLTLISCSTWLLIREKASLKFDSYQSNSIILVLFSIFFFLFAFSVLSIQFRMNLYERPLIYFILTSLMGGIVALEIIFSQENHNYFILFQTIVIGLSVAWSQLLIFPSLLGVDPWWHQMFTTKIMETHYIPDSYSYSKLPIFHLAIASTSLITGLNYKFATMLSVSLAQIICNALFLFLLGKFLFNQKVGLLASLMVIIANHHIFMSYWSIPNSLAAVFIPIVLYLLWKVRRDKPLHATVLSILFMGILILTHTVTAMCMAIILFVCWAASNLYNILYSKTEIPVSLTISLLFTVAMFGWWTYASGHITTLANLIKWGFSIDYFVHTPKEILKYAATVPVPEQIFNNVAMFLFFSLSFVGIFYMISKKGNSFSFAAALAGFILLALGFFSLITGHSIIEHRWWYFSQILLAIPLAVAIILIGKWKGRSSRFVSIFSFVFVVSLTFLMIMSPPANVDNHIFSPNTGVRYALTESEMQAIKITSEVWNGTLGADRYYSSNSMWWMGYNTKPIDDCLYKKDFKECRSMLVLIRSEIINKPFKLFQSTYRLDYDPRIILEEEIEYSKIYENGQVSGYLCIQSQDAMNISSSGMRMHGV